jgi:prepilin-type N-terminal cleavage/methylation domain-containing protein
VATIKQNGMTMSKRKLQHLCTQSSQAGFTIIESLIAITIASLLLAAIAPVIILSTGNRVQARRVELASQAAKAYIDGVSAGSIDAPDAAEKNISTFDAPGTGSLSSSCKSNQYCSQPAKKLYCIDGDNSGDCTNSSSKDLIIQAFRTGTKDDDKQGYGMALRVYRADAFQGSEALLKNSATKTTQASFGIKLGVGARKTPLVEMTTEVVTQNTTFRDLCSRLKDGTNKSSGC